MQSHKTQHYYTCGAIPQKTACLGESERLHIDGETHRPIFERCNPEQGDVLLTKDGVKTGEVAINTLDIEFSLLSSVALFKPVREVLDSKYLRYFLESPVGMKMITGQMSGTAIKRIVLAKLRTSKICLAPLDEQLRIVARIEELFSQLDAGVALLQKLKVKLKRYRQAVLKAAVEGKLTEDWREAHRDELEPASALLKRIRQQRREAWEADYLAKQAAKGKTPKNDKWKEKYKEPIQPETEGLAELPDNWNWICLDSVLLNIEAGKSFKCEGRPPTLEEVGVAKVSAVSWGEFNELESKVCLEKEKVNPDFYVQEGDFLFSRANTIELVGACVIAKQVKRKVMLSDKTLRFHFAQVSQSWFLIALRTRLGRDEIERLATGNQDSMRNIGQARIRQIRIP